MIGALLAAAALQIQSDAAIEYQARGSVAMTAYRLCLTKKTADFVRSGEPAGDIVDGAFGSCASFRLELADLPRKVGLNVSDEAVEKSLKWVDEQERRRLLGFVMEARRKH